MKFTLLNRFVLCILFAMLPILESFAAAGKFNFVMGDVRVASASGERKAEKGSEVEAGETIVSGKDGVAQLRMSDGAFIAVRADTALRIDQYQFSGKADASSTSVLSLVNGTFRAFTGAIAAFNKDKFVMKTPGATIGIRGSGNVLNFTSGNGITLNHTIEGSHTITAKDPGGAMRTLVTMPGQTVQVNATGAMQFVPTPAFILNAATGASEPKMKQQNEQLQRSEKKGIDKQDSADKGQGKGPAAETKPQGGAQDSAIAGKPDLTSGSDGTVGGTPPGKGAAPGVVAVPGMAGPPGMMMPGMTPGFVAPAPGIVAPMGMPGMNVPPPMPPPMPKITLPPSMPTITVPPPMPTIIVPPPMPTITVPPPMPNTTVSPLMP